MYGQGMMKVTGPLTSTWTNLRTGLAVTVPSHNENLYTIQMGTKGEFGDTYRVTSLGPAFFQELVQGEDGILTRGRSY